MQHSHGLPAGVQLKHNDMEEVIVVVVVMEAFVFSYFASLLFTIVKKVKVISFPKWETKFRNS